MELIFVKKEVKRFLIFNSIFVRIMRMRAHSKMYMGAILMAFWSIILVSQVTNLKIQNPKLSKVSFNKQSNKGPVGSSTNDSQTNPIDNTEEEEEDDDEFNLESTLLNAYQHEIFIIKHSSFQNYLIRDPHREIFSPPPQA